MREPVRYGKPLQMPQNGLTIQNLLDGIDDFIESAGMTGWNKPYPHKDYASWTPGTSLEAMVVQSLPPQDAGQLGAEIDGCFSHEYNKFSNKELRLTPQQVTQIISNLTEQGLPLDTKVRSGFNIEFFLAMSELKSSPAQNTNVASQPQEKWADQRVHRRTHEQQHSGNQMYR